MHQMFQQIFSGHFEEGFELAMKVTEAGRRHREPISSPSDWSARGG